MRSSRTAIAGAATLLALAAVVVPSIGSADSCNTDWAMFQHDVSRSAAAPSCSSIGTQQGSPLSAETLAPAWFFQTPGAVTAEPAIATVNGKKLGFVGDYEGNFYGIDLATGKLSTDWKNGPFNVGTTDRHNPSYGKVTSSAAVTTIPSGHGDVQAVIFGAGGSVYALNAADGTLLWHTNVDPDRPTSDAEVESSPLVWQKGGGNSVVFVGMDVNEDKATATTPIIDGGVLALNANDGSPLWKFDPQTGSVLDGADALHKDIASTGCGDVWSSPSLDPATSPSDATLFFAVGNCDVNDGKHPSGDTEFVYAISADGGTPKWRFEEPPLNHGVDTDFGASPILTTVKGRPVVVEPGKSGWVYVVDRVSGARVAEYKVANGGQYGGFIGSGAVTTVNGDPTFLGASAIPVHVDSSLTDSPTSSNPLGPAALHALDLATGKILWDQPVHTPEFGPVTTVNDVVFAPDTTQFSMAAYDTATGAPIYRLPLGAAPSGGAAISGNTIVVGAGTFFGDQVPPQLTGVWCFRPAAG